MLMSATSVLLDGLVFPECPRWHQGKLWLSDMGGHKVLTVDAKGRSEVIASVQRPGGLGFLPDGRLLMVSEADPFLRRLDPDGLHTAADLSPLGSVVLNDMVVDRAGRAYIGDDAFDMAAGAPPRPGRLILVTPDGDPRVVAEGLGFPNGMVITPDGKTLIVAETIGRRLTAFDVADDGSLTDRRLFADLGVIGPTGILPDGICLDAEGAVWVASLATGEFVRVTEGGAVAQRVPVPGKWAVACTLGGENRRTFFLCTARTTPEDLAQGKSTGSIETARVHVPGAGLP
jgi:sugar lactone lactonase YvrE